MWSLVFAIGQFESTFVARQVTVQLARLRVAITCNRLQVSTREVPQNHAIQEA